LGSRKTKYPERAARGEAIHFPVRMGKPMGNPPKAMPGLPL
jgi:hypothetical protein